MRSARSYSILPRSLAFLAILLCVSCAKAPDTARVPADTETSKAVWNRFKTVSERAENASSPFRLNATLYYSGKEDSQRVSAYLWGNNSMSDPYPVRLDILMGPGSVIATTREDLRGLFIYVPREQTVYHAENDGLLAFGVPLPFKLKDLAALVTGRFARVFTPQGGEEPPTFKGGEEPPAFKGGEEPPAFNGDENTLIYMVDQAALAGYVKLSENGLPVSWEDGTENGWRLTIDYWPDSTRRTPRKLHIEHVGEKREATLIVRELASPEKPFSGKELQLNVPENTRLAPLDGSR